MDNKTRIFVGAGVMFLVLVVGQARLSGHASGGSSGQGCGGLPEQPEQTTGSAAQAPTGAQGAQGEALAAGPRLWKEGTSFVYDVQSARTVSAGNVSTRLQGTLALTVTAYVTVLVSPTAKAPMVNDVPAAFRVADF